MAGSWDHAVDKDNNLKSPEQLNDILDTPGDWVEFAEEAFGMVLYLADTLSAEEGLHTSDFWIEQAKLRWADHLEA